MTRVCLSTCSSMEEAQTLAHALLQERLIACANLIPGAVSCYWWEGAIQQEQEVVLVMKTVEDRLVQLRERLPQLHAYTTPELLVLPVEGGLPAYLQWVRDATLPGGQG